MRFCGACTSDCKTLCCSLVIKLKACAACTVGPITTAAPTTTAAATTTVVTTTDSGLTSESSHSTDYTSPTLTGRVS